MGERVEVMDVGAPVTLQVWVAVHAAISRLVIGYMIKDRLGQPVFGTNTDYMEQPLRDLAAGERARFRFRFAASLGPGSYSVAVALHSTESHIVNNYEWRDLALVFNVVNMSRPTFIGNAWLPPSVVVEQVVAFGSRHDR